MERKTLGKRTIMTKGQVAAMRKNEENELKRMFDDDEDETTFESKYDESNDDSSQENDENESFSNETTDEDILDEVIPFIESIEDGIYPSVITSVRTIRNGKILISFDIKVDNEYFYPLVSFFDRCAVRGNSTFLLLNAFKERNMTFNSLLNRSLFISVKVNCTDNGKVYENIVDFRDCETCNINDLKVDKYGRFID